MEEISGDHQTRSNGKSVQVQVRYKILYTYVYISVRGNIRRAGLTAKYFMLHNKYIIKLTSTVMVCLNPNHIFLLKEPLQVFKTM